MKGIQAACPSCAAPVRFKISTSLVSVCEFCQSIVARTDRKLEDLGKVAAIVETASPLHLGLKGKAFGKSFEVVGRTQYQHAAGGRWDEWYVAFSNGKWGWLAEAQGRFYLTTERSFGTETLPEFGSLPVGGHIPGPEGEPWTVAEVGTATAIAAAGEIPFTLRPNAVHRYADIYGPGKKFATLDYGAPDEPAAGAKAYVGRELTLDDLGISPTAVAPQEDRVIRGLALNCPQCAGPLSLRAPDQTQRVGCPSCGALLDCQQGQLSFLMSLEKGNVQQLIPLGTEGEWQGVNYTVIGFMQRAVAEEGKFYPWCEYLLYNPRAGFRWLVHSDSHWSFVEPVSPGDVSGSRLTRTYDGRVFRAFQSGLAKVWYVVGEFYWRVEVGEEVASLDYIAPPLMLSAERSTAKADGSAPESSEIQYSLGTYVRPEEIEQAFHLQGLPRGWSVAPNQPNPADRRVYVAWLGFAALLVVLHLGLGAFRAAGDPFFLGMGLVLVSLLPIGTLLYQFGFESSRWQTSNLTNGSD